VIRHRRFAIRPLGFRRPPFPRGARVAWRCASLVVLGLSWACSKAGLAEVGGPEGATHGPGEGASFLERVEQAPFDTAFRGQRRVELRYGAVPVEYREEVASDGQGQFSLLISEVLSSMPDPELFTELQNKRQVFTYRFRDWRIRDYDLFLQNYEVTLLSTDAEVAGVPCVELDVRRAVAEPRCVYTVDVDPSTGLVLSWEERDPAGQRLARVEFETFELNADVSDLELVSRTFSGTTSYPLDGDLQSVFGFQPLIPTVLPDEGARIEPEVDRMLVGSDVYARVTVTDGLEVAVLMSRKPSPKNKVPSRILYSELGTWAAFEGECYGYPILAAGKFAPEGLKLMIESTK